MIGIVVLVQANWQRIANAAFNSAAIRTSEDQQIAKSNSRCTTIAEESDNATMVEKVGAPSGTQTFTTWVPAFPLLGKSGCYTKTSEGKRRCTCTCMYIYTHILKTKKNTHTQKKTFHCQARLTREQ